MRKNINAVDSSTTKIFYAELFVSSEPYKLEYKGLCGVAINISAKALILQPEDTELRTIKVSLNHYFVRTEKLLCSYSDNINQDVALFIYRNTDCKELHDDILEYQATAIIKQLNYKLSNQEWTKRFLLPLIDATTDNLMVKPGTKKWLINFWTTQAVDEMDNSSEVTVVHPVTPINNSIIKRVEPVNSNKEIKRKAPIVVKKEIKSEITEACGSGIVDNLKDDEPPTKQRCSPPRAIPFSGPTTFTQKMVIKPLNFQSKTSNLPAVSQQPRHFNVPSQSDKLNNGFGIKTHVSNNKASTSISLPIPRIRVIKPVNFQLKNEKVVNFHTNVKD
jgi:hypothetical protein